MLAYGHFPKCKHCGGDNAVILNDEHIDKEECYRHKAEKLINDFCKAHDKMVSDPAYFSKSNPTKQAYYGLLYELTDKCKAGYRASD